MIPIRSHFSKFGSPRGSAILVVLVFVVVISVMLVTYLARTERAVKLSGSSASIVQTNILAETATAAILDDLRQEMLAGSEGVSDAGNMIVEKPWAMVPARVLKDNSMLDNEKFANLVKQSVYNKQFYPGSNPPIYNGQGNARASNINTSTPSRNGRFVSPERWSAPRLLGDASGVGTFAAGQTPDWILISREGPVANGNNPGNVSDKKSNNNQYVIGRFAYNIYDVGGLLDINVAGYDPADAGIGENAKYKGSTVWADLSVIPGMQSNDIQELIDWRNKLSKSQYLKMIKGLKPGDTDNAAKNPWGEPGGFQRPYSDDSSSDNRFYSRQDLLNYFDRKYGNDASKKTALSYFTTFSADLDQPSYRPSSNRPKVKYPHQSGGNDAYGNDDKINPPFLDVKGNDGQPRVKRRFPLERLKYLTHNGPLELNDGRDKDQVVREYFGLEWRGNRWYYVDGTSDGRILNLDEIPAGREPNFFELLKAAIAPGSLGGQYQLEGTTESPNSPRRIGRNDLLGYDGSIDLHIMKIGANIIDQYDSDSYPTRIELRDGNIVSGIENLPYLYRTRIATYRLAGGKILPENMNTTARNDYLSKVATDTSINANRKYPWRNVVLLQPMLWNPHAPNEVASVGPTNFRVVAKTTTPFVLRVYKPFWGSSSYTTTFPSSDPRDTQGGSSRSLSLANGDYINFTTTSTGPASFREPYTLRAPNIPEGSQASTPGMNPQYEQIVNGDRWDETEPNTPAKSQAIGFRLGYIWTGPFKKLNTNTDEFLYLNRMTVQNATATLELQYLSPQGEWVTFDSMEELTFPSHEMFVDTAQSTAEDLAPRNSEDQRTMRYLVRMDPRTMRYNVRGAHSLQPYARGRTANSRWLEGESFYPQRTDNPSGRGTVRRWGFNASAGYATGTQTKGWYYNGTDTANKAWGTISENKPRGVAPTIEPGSSRNYIYYEDPDGIVRRAMGGYSTWSNTSSSSATKGPMAWTGNGDYSHRPVILNRPFRSVAELGYAFRDQPWKQIDFWTPESADAALLDVFCIHEPAEEDEDPIVSGRVNLNSARKEVLQALLRGVRKDEKGELLSDSQVEGIANALVDWRKDTNTAKGPFRGRHELVGRPVNSTTYSGFSQEIATLIGNTDTHIQERRQSALRALVDAGTTRTWNLLIDLIVQSGHYPPGTSVQAGSDAFIVSGEARYWVHVAIDRFTGKIVAQLVEPVHE